LPRSADAVVERRSWEVPRIFTEIQRLGDVADEEMLKVFNLGVGMILAVPGDDVFRTFDTLRSYGHAAVEIGVIESGHGRIRFVP
jgi:phosphoribosylformylglycinamidine cyclo-ligase